jgi:aminoglycoside phosphotransferase (APT) family kinase protein/ubiquinone/menaquinone biosynthesis C-methylase UbiE
MSMAYKINSKMLSDYLSHCFRKHSNLIPLGATKIRIHDLSRITGVRHGIYTFSLVFRHNQRDSILRLILKLYTDEEITKREYLTLRALERVGYSVPKAYALETNEKILGAPFIIMEEIEGKTMRDYVKYLSKKETFNFFEHFAETLVNLHELKFEKAEIGFLETPKDEYDYAKKQALKEEEELLEYVKDQDFEWATNWLENNAFKCPCKQFSLLHNDMNPKNFLITKTGRIVFLDWTWSEIGDALKDVAYAYHNIQHMFGARKIDKKGVEIATHFLKQYIKRSSRKIDSFTLQFYLVSAGMREAVALKNMSEEFKHPSSIIRIMGATFLPMAPFGYWHFRSRSQHLKRFVESIAGDYEQKMFGTLGGRILSLMEIDAILRFLGPVSSEELVLDIGTGSGRIAREILLKTKARVVGIDVGRSNIKSAKTRARNLGYYEVVIAEGQHLPFKVGSFDRIICIRALKYFPNYVQGLAEMSRVLKSGKRLVVDLSSILGYEIILRRITRSLSARSSHLFNFYRMKELLRRHKFAITDSVPLQKIPHKIWNFSRNLTFLKLLIISENILKNITPSLLSRSILVKCIKAK